MAASVAASVRLVLLGGFSLRHGDDPVDFPLSAQRLLAFLALQNRPLQRGHVAGALWPRASERRSQASLRTALWRVQHVTGAQTVDASHTRLELGPGVRVDVREALELVEAVDAGDLPPVRRTLALLDADLLPDWDDDWLVPDVERWRQLRLHSLETLAGRFAEAGRFAGAVEAALAAVRAEPLRESANRCLVSVHLAEGNSLEALRAYETFRRALRSDLGMEPSARMALLIDGLSPA